MVKDGSRFIAPVKQELKTLFPDGVTVGQKEGKFGVVSQVSGSVKPLRSALLPAFVMSHSGTGNRHIIARGPALSLLDDAAPPTRTEASLIEGCGFT